MKLELLKILIFFLILTLTNSFSDCTPQGKRKEELSADLYSLEWETDLEKNNIEFSVSVKTEGWVGFGLSLSGSMAGSDIVIGGVHSNGTIYFDDYHGPETGNGMPTKDEASNWELLEANEDSGTTSLRFRRLLDTCDLNEEDLPITTGSIKIIWSFGETDSVSYHGSIHRGAMALNLLDPPLPEVDLSKYRETHFVTKVRLSKNKRTLYWSSLFKRTANESSHIVGFKPRLESPEAIRHTHHFNFYTCKAPLTLTQEKFLDSFLADHPSVYIVPGFPAYYCVKTLYNWSLGGRLLMFPEDLGIKWGTHTNEYFRIEIHLDNHEGSDAEFLTGLTVYDTDDLRTKEAGMFSVGHITGPTLFIPPKTKDWTIVGHCSGGCTRKILSNGTMNIFNIVLHSHLSGRKMKVRHFRDDVELPWISNDETYDASYQENRPLPKEVVVLPGDQISLECTYDSNWNAPSAVIGGMATTHEMCMFFAYYYPKVESELEDCFSVVSETKIYNRFGIHVGSHGSTSNLETYLDPVIRSPHKWSGRLYSDILTNEIEWTDDFKSSLQEELLFGDHVDDCLSPSSESVFVRSFKNLSAPTEDFICTAPGPEYIIVKEIMTEENLNLPNKTTNFSVWIIVAIVIGICVLGGIVHYFKSHRKSERGTQYILYKLK